MIELLGFLTGFLPFLILTILVIGDRSKSKEAKDTR